MLVRYVVFVLALFSLGGFLYASVFSCDEMCREMNRVVDEASRNAALRDDAFQFLVLITEGRGGRPSAQLISRLRLTEIVGTVPADPDISLRAEAFRRLGELATPQAIRYLKRFTEKDFSPNDRRTLWAAVQIGLLTAELEEMGSSPQKHQLLESLLLTDSATPVRGDVQSWAWNRLCDDGVLGALPLIKAAMDDYYGDGRSIDEGRFCEERMWSVSGKPNPIDAYRDVLIHNAGASERLRLWAFDRVIRMNTDESRKVLNAFIQWVDGLPAGHPDRAALQETRRHLRTMQLD